MSDKTIVNLSDEDAARFVLFLKYYDNIKLLLDAQVFNQKNASIALNFDANGVLKTIQRADVLYSARHQEK